MGNISPVGFGQEPKAAPLARWWSILVGLGCISLGLLGIREFWLLSDPSLPWQLWLSPLWENFAQQSAPGWLHCSAIAALILGLFFGYAAVKPRRRTHRAIPAAISLWTRNVDIARYTTATAKRLPDVNSASTIVTASSVEIRLELNVIAAEVTQATAWISAELREALRPLLGDNIALRVHVTPLKEEPDEP